MHKNIKNKRKGFTLVELLAVVVILAVILVISVPKITDTIESSRLGAIEATARTIISGAEREYTSKLMLDETYSNAIIPCSDVVELNSDDYDVNSCKVTFSDNIATIDLTGKGKFDGYICKGTKDKKDLCKKSNDESTIEPLACTVELDYDETEPTGINMASCKAYLKTIMPDSYKQGLSEDEINESILYKCSENVYEYLLDYFKEGEEKDPFKDESLDTTKYPIPEDFFVYGGIPSEYEYYNGQYVYTYYANYIRQDDRMVSGWNVRYNGDMGDDVIINEPICSSINGEPIISSSGAFYGVTASKIDLSKWDTSNIVEMYGMFATAIIKDEIDLSNFDTSNVIDMSLMFQFISSGYDDYRYPTKVIFGDKFDTSNVTNMNYMFEGASIENFDLSKFDTSKVVDMSGMFYGNEIKKLDLSNFDTSNVKNMYGMFDGISGGCYNRRCYPTEIIFGDKFDTSKVTDMSYMFSDAKIRELDISKFDTSNVKDMIGVFESIDGGYLNDDDEGSFVNIIFGDKFNISSVTKISDMFQFSSIQELDLSSWDTSRLDEINNNNKSGIFNSNLIENVYVKTLADANRLKTLYDKDIFKVKTS